MSNSKFRNRFIDILVAVFVLLWLIVLIIPYTRAAYQYLSSDMPFLLAFVNFSILASIGELIGLRISVNFWHIPSFFLARFVVWGLLGIMIMFIFNIFYGGIIASQQNGILPFPDSQIATAFLTSAFMNTSFGPVLFAFRKVFETFLRLKSEKKGKISMEEIANEVNWNRLFTFFWLKCCFLFYIPVHTVVFMLPYNLRIIISAFMSIVLGLIVAFFSRKKAGGAAFQATKLVPLSDIQPSQFYVNEEKLKTVGVLLKRPKDICIPVTIINGKMVAQDGHTRMKYAEIRQWTHIYTYEEKMDKGIDFFTNEAQKRSIKNISDMHIITDDEYQTKWKDYCEEYYKNIN